MGLLGSSKKTFVSSSVWNLAGDVNERTDYLKTVVVGNIIFDSPVSMGEAIPNAYLKGPGMALRLYTKWSQGPSNYGNDVGAVSGGITFGNSLDTSVLSDYLTHEPSEILVINESDIGFADPDWWADEYMVNNHQDLLFTDWYSEYMEDTGDIVITFEDTTTETFTPVGLDLDKRYLYCLYQTFSGGVNGPITPGPVTTVPNEAGFPATTGYELYSDVDSSVATTLTRKVVTDSTYSDGRPAEHSEVNDTVPGSINTNEKTYHKYVITDTNHSVRYIYVQTRSQQKAAGTPTSTTTVTDIGGGVTRTTTVVTTVQTLIPLLSYHMDTQEVVNDTLSEYKYFRYEEGSGEAALDSMFAIPDSAGNFVPYIPIRINNSFIRDFDPALYKKTQRAFSKAMCGAKLDKVVDKIEENDSLSELDYVYTVYGTSLNSPEKAARIYMFRFFDLMVSSSPDVYSRFADWELQWAAASGSMDAMQEWAESRTGTSTTPPPSVIPYPALPVLRMDMSSSTSWMNFHMAIEFNGGQKISGSGLLPGHAKGDYWIEQKPNKVYEKKFVQSYNGGGSDTSVVPIVIEHIVFYHQVSDTNWEAIEMFGLVHRNYVYNGKWVVIKGSEALADSEESGFLVPLHEQTFREMRLIDATQLATAGCYLVFNCYKEVKQKWYQTGWFKVLLVVVIVVVTIVFPPAGGATGVLGSSAAVGTAIGFSGTAALVAGIVANAIAAMVIMKALTSAFGNKLGPLLGAVVTVLLTIYGGPGGAGSFDTSTLITELSKAQNLMALTDGLVKSVSGFMNDKAQAIMAEAQKVMEQNKSDMMLVAKKYEEMFGTNKGMIDPLLYTHAGYTGVTENRETYIERTLMCGSDIAQMTQDLIKNFTQISTSLDLPS